MIMRRPEKSGPVQRNAFYKSAAAFYEHAVFVERAPR
jgi:hypothetical protein